jgi:predicted carbohydrate-binding protein with CBM48
MEWSVSEMHDDLIRRVANDLKAPVTVDPAFDGRVLAAIERLPVPRETALGAVWLWLRRPRVVRVSPLAALAAAAGLAALLLALPRGGSPAPDTQAAGRDTAAVQFLLLAPEAGSVALVGDFNDWDSGTVPMQRAAPSGVWTATIPLAPGRYRYAFVVDGRRWATDPAAPSAPGDDFGTRSSIVTVGGD